MIAEINEFSVFDKMLCEIWWTERHQDDCSRVIKYWKILLYQIFTVCMPLLMTNSKERQTGITLTLCLGVLLWKCNTTISADKLFTMFKTYFLFEKYVF